VGLLCGAHKIGYHQGENQGTQDRYDGQDKAVPLGLAGKLCLDGSNPSFPLKLILRLARHGLFPCMTEFSPCLRSGRKSKKGGKMPSLD
jgi:hypothetical protein